MSTDTLSRVTKRTVVELSSDRDGALYFGDAKGSDKPAYLTYTMITRTENGVDVPVMQFKNVPVFRSGTFRDSMGEQLTWSHTHMLEMQNHYHLLRDMGAFEDVMVRAGHGSFFGDDPLKGVIGYVTDLRVEKMTSKNDGQEYSVLLADYEILDVDAQAKIGSGLWRNRSAEIGDFITNDDQVYGPTFVGFAYVDRPAVQNLNSFGAQRTEEPITIITEDSTMTQPTHQNPPLPANPAPHVFRLGEKNSSDPAEVEAYIASLTSQNSNYAAQVASLTEFRTEALKEARHSAIRALADGPDAKILSTQVDGLIAFADASLTDDKAFQAWIATYSDMPSVGIVGTLPNGDPAAGQFRAGDPDPKVAAHETDLQILRDFKFSMAWSDERVLDTEAYARVKAHDPSFTLGSLTK